MINTKKIFCNLMLIKNVWSHFYQLDLTFYMIEGNALHFSQFESNTCQKYLEIWLFKSLFNFLFFMHSFQFQTTEEHVWAFRASTTIFAKIKYGKAFTCFHKICFEMNLKRYLTLYLRILQKYFLNFWSTIDIG